MVKFPNDLNDFNEYRGMVHWFSPSVLIKVVQKVIASTLFGQYADRRLVHAALDVVDDSLASDRCGGKLGIIGNTVEPVWVDYVADLGDGFDATYAIAYLIGQQSIEVEGHQLPRAQCLIMGGDQVYPDASREDYEKRMQRPYEAAFPRSNLPGAVRPPVFLIPGNHDWYDGLTLFLGKFCRGLDTHLGSWNAKQSRSYFAFQLKDNWWIWGYDSQLGEDIDMPQANYFTRAARTMSEGAKVIICAPVPSWLGADQRANDPSARESFYRGLDHMALLLADHCPQAKVPLVLAGDLHHYSRFASNPAGTQFITAGGGGAFLHPTHNLPTENIDASWAKTRQTMALAQVREAADKEAREACYPSRRISRWLALRNFAFVFKNPDFCLTLGLIYWISGLLLLSWRGYGQAGDGDTIWERGYSLMTGFLPTPPFVVVAVCFLLAIVGPADIHSWPRKLAFAGIHGLAHIAILAVTTGLAAAAAYSLQFLPFGEILYPIGIGLGAAAAGFVGGFAWGIYLLVASFVLGAHSNDAFSAMRLDWFRHFLRLKIDGDQLTVYPICIDRSPRRTDWEKNPKYVENVQSQPFLTPKFGLGQHFIEPPIVIDVGSIKPLRP